VSISIRHPFGNIVNSDPLEPCVSFPSVTILETVGRSAPLTLEKRTVYVWGFSLEGSDRLLTQFEKWLSPEERARSTRFIHREHQIRFSLAHCVLRALLARYAGHEPSELRLHTSATGKPMLLDQRNTPHSLRFNLSHSHRRMLVALAQDLDVGVDVEQVRDKVEVLKLAERFYTPREYQDLLNCCRSDQNMQFYRYWVAKEALLKGQGVGLLSLKHCEIHSRAGSRVIAGISPGSTLETGWSIQWLSCGTGWQGAVSAYGTEWSVRVINEGSM
jgi:4'-phosphopantetheinyl transferase